MSPASAPGARVATGPHLDDELLHERFHLFFDSSSLPFFIGKAFIRRGPFLWTSPKQRELSHTHAHYHHHTQPLPRTF